MSKKTIYFNNFWHTPVNFLLQARFTFFIKSKTENQLKFKQYIAPAQRVCATVKLLRRDTSYFIIAPNLWLLNIFDFSPVDYRIFTMLQEWVCQHPMRDVDKLRQRLIDRRMVIDQAIDWWRFRLKAWVGHWPEMDILNIWYHPMF